MSNVYGESFLSVLNFLSLPGSPEQSSCGKVVCSASKISLQKKKKQKTNKGNEAKQGVQLHVVFDIKHFTFYTFVEPGLLPYVVCILGFHRTHVVEGGPLAL